MKNRTFASTNPSRTRRRRRGTSRLFVLSAALMASTAVGGKLATPVHAQGTLRDTRIVTSRAIGSSVIGAVDEGQAQPVTFDIPAGAIGTVAERFRVATGIRVVFANEDIKELPSPGVSGVMTAEQALERLLVGTGVGYVFTARDLITMDLRTSEFVAVSGRETPTVSSPKYTTPLRDVPQTIALIPRATIEQQGATTLSETLRNVPGITLQAGEAGGASNTAGDMFNMRGFNASNSLFVDGVRDDGLVSRDVFNVEQVEVFMGPTGSDVGRGTAAGYVNMSTKVPHLGSSSSAMVSYGNGDRGRVTTDLNFSSSGDSESWWGKSAFRLNALWQDGGVQGRDEVEQESRAVAPSLAFGLGTSTRLSLAAQILRQENLPDYGIPGAAWQEEPLTPTTIQTPGPVDQANYYGSPAFRSRRCGTGQLLAARRTRCQPALHTPQPGALQPRQSRRHHQHDPEPGVLRRGHEQGRHRASGQHSREHDRIQPDEHDRPLFDRRASPLIQLRPRVHARSAIRSNTHRSRHPGARGRVQSQSHRSRDGIRAGAIRRLHRWQHEYGLGVLLRHR